MDVVEWGVVDGDQMVVDGMVWMFDKLVQVMTNWVVSASIVDHQKRFCSRWNVAVIPG